MPQDPHLCVCGHRHWTTRGPCTMWERCGCKVLRVQRVQRPRRNPDQLVWSDTDEQIRRRRVELLDAANSCEHDLHKIRRDPVR